MCLECGVTVRTVQYYDEKGLLSPTQRKMLLEGIVVDIVEVGCIAGGIIRKNWWPLVAAAPLMIIITSEFVQIYHRDARYVCPHCHAVFQPGMREFFFSAHTPKTRKLSCVNCGTKDCYVEIPAEQGMDA